MVPWDVEAQDQVIYMLHGQNNKVKQRKKYSN